ncbi:nuclear transcription factor Y subunit B-4-like [Henckelia pumila]|uniref:nuclear transcription factor Y subunit B-4-like n=1 Tax=Henckelia pumila TaxID=405737 RepID=UPI003C6E8AD6
MTDEHEKLLPIANVGRIMKQILPRNAKISKEGKETMQECASEFISFVTSEASEKCNRENRKTVNGDDICWALSSLGFDHYSEGMLRYLGRFREYENQRAISIQNNNCTTEDKEELEETGYGGATNFADPFFDFGILEKGTASTSKPSCSNKFQI